jgi:threonine dehydratase
MREAPDPLGRVDFILLKRIAVSSIFCSRTSARRSRAELLRQLNREPGVEADVVMGGCGAVYVLRVASASNRPSDRPKTVGKVLCRRERDIHQLSLATARQLALPSCGSRCA